MKDTTKLYWIQTGKLFGLIVLVHVILIALVIGGAPHEPLDGVSVITGIAIIGAAIHLYKGFGFLKGLGGYLLAKFPFALLFALMG